MPVRPASTPTGPTPRCPPCGGPSSSYEEIADNAFYCPDDDFIAWDEADASSPSSTRSSGLHRRHRDGPRVRPRHPGPRPATADRTIDLELQADCFAGAWSRTSPTASSDGFGAATIDLDQTVAGHDRHPRQPGTDADDPLAHGAGSTGSARSRTATRTTPASAPSTPTPASTAARPSSNSTTASCRPGATSPSTTTGRPTARACSPWWSATSTPSTTGVPGDGRRLHARRRPGSRGPGHRRGRLRRRDELRRRPRVRGDLLRGRERGGARRGRARAGPQRHR